MDTVTVNRAPVLTLWASLAAERLGFDRKEALTLGKAVAGLTAQSKGQRLGIFTPSPDTVRRQRVEYELRPGKAETHPLPVQAPGGLVSSVGLFAAQNYPVNCFPAVQHRRVSGRSR
jgi:hypothetical protein